MITSRKKVFLLSLIIVVAFFLNVCEAEAEDNNNIFIIPKLSNVNNQVFIESINLETGQVEKTDFKAIYNYKVINIGNGNAIIVGESAPNSSKVDIYLYNVNSKKPLQIDNDAVDTGVYVKSYKRLFAIDYSTDDGIEMRIYQTMPLKLIARIVNNYGELITFNERFVYYSNSKNIIVCSATDGKLIKRVPMPSEEFEVLSENKCMFYLASGKKKIVDLVNWKSREFLLNGLNIAFTNEDGTWSIIPQYKLKSAYLAEFTGKVTIVNTVSGKKYETLIDSLIINNFFKTTGDAILIRNGKAYFLGKTKMIVINLKTGKKEYRNLKRELRSDGENKIAMTSFEKNQISRISVEKAAEIAVKFCRRPNVGVQAYHDSNNDRVIKGEKYYYFDMIYGLLMGDKPTADDNVINSLYVNSSNGFIYEAVEKSKDGVKIIVPGKVLKK